MDLHEGLSRHQWGQTAAICCIIANAARDPKKQRRPFYPDDFNPHVKEKYRGPSGMPVTADNIDMIIGLFVKE